MNHSSEIKQCKYISDIYSLLYKKPSFAKLADLYAHALVIPVTTASAERSFSALKRIKTYLRNTTQQERLSSLAIISINENEVDVQKVSENSA
jgi:hypothetical protein